jgi:hypothetical protein
MKKHIAGSKSGIARQERPDRNIGGLIQKKRKKYEGIWTINHAV